MEYPISLFQSGILLMIQYFSNTNTAPDRLVNTFINQQQKQALKADTINRTGNLRDNNAKCCTL